MSSSGLLHRASHNVAGRVGRSYLTRCWPFPDPGRGRLIFRATQNRPPFVRSLPSGGILDFPLAAARRSPARRPAGGRSPMPAVSISRTRRTASARSPVSPAVGGNPVSVGAAPARLHWLASVRRPPSLLTGPLEGVRVPIVRSGGAGPPTNFQWRLVGWGVAGPSRAGTAIVSGSECHPVAPVSTWASCGLRYTRSGSAASPEVADIEAAVHAHRLVT